MKLHTVQFITFSCHFLPHGCNYSLEHLFFKHSSLRVRDQVSHKRKVTLLFACLDRKAKDSALNPYKHSLNLMCSKFDFR
jgi:hypothetical protein